MERCSSQPKPQLYGVGLRLAFYIQWRATSWFRCIGRVDVTNVCLLGVCLSGSMCLSLLAQVMESTARSSELYIMAMLTIGGHILLVPIYAWRVITCCNSSWGALHHSQSQRIPRVLRVVDFVTVVVASSVAVWLFAVRLPEPGMFCNEYGFLFGKASMRDWSFAVSNTALYICILVVCVALVLLRWVCLLHKVNSRRYSRLKERCRR